MTPSAAVKARRFAQMPETTLLVLAKDPRPGHAKTRLTPPFSPAEAAELAAAALADTLEAVLDACRVEPRLRSLLVCDGVPGDWLPSDMSWVPQIDGSLDQRIGAAFDLVAGGSALLIGMDTPQVTAELLLDAAGRLAQNDAVFGPASDGGWWALGMTRADGSLVRGIPTSIGETGALQRERLRHAGLAVDDLAVLTDVDTAEDASAVAELIPGSRFGMLLAELARSVA